MSTLIERCYACNERVDSIGRCYNHRCENYRGKEAAPTPFRQGLTKEPCSLHDGLNCMARCNCTLASNQVFKPSIESKVQEPTALVHFLNSIIHLSPREQTDAIGLYMLQQEGQLSELREAAQGVCGYLISLSDGTVTAESPIPLENLKRLEAALAKP